MKKHRKTWTLAEKLQVLHYEKTHGLTITSREFDVSITSISKWRKTYEEYGEQGLMGKQKTAGETEELRQLRRENAMLKKLLAEKELRISIQTDMLKKSH